MQKNNHPDTPEFASLPPELSAPGAHEFSPPPREFSPGSDEGQSPPRRRKLWKLAASALVAAAVILPNAGQIAPEPPPVIQAAPSRPTEPLPPETTVETIPEPLPETIPETVPETIPETYPLGDGDCLITVYNDDVDMDNGFRNRILYQELIHEPDFTELPLPEPMAVDGYRFAGYVIFYGSLAADFQEEGYLPGTEEFAVPVSSPLTSDDLVRVPVWRDGVRYVNIHVCWVPEDEGDPLLFLDDGAGNTTGFSLAHPLQSGGFIFLSAYPAPERENYRFAGWYNTEGNRVTYLFMEDLYPVIGAGDDGYEQRDWRNPQPVTLTAGWIPE